MGASGNVPMWWMVWEGQTGQGTETHKVADILTGNPSNRKVHQLQGNYPPPQPAMRGIRLQADGGPTLTARCSGSWRKNKLLRFTWHRYKDHRCMQTQGCRSWPKQNYKGSSELKKEHLSNWGNWDIRKKYWMNYLLTSDNRDVNTGVHWCRNFGQYQ